MTQQIAPDKFENDFNLKKKKGCKICIEGLVDDKKMTYIEESDIRKYFQGYGTIEDIEIPRDHISKKPKGWVLVEFSNP